MVSHMVSHMVSPVAGLQKGPSCCPTALPTALLGGATAASLLLFEREQNLRMCSGDCGPVWFLCRGNRTVECALGTVVLSGFSAEGTEL